MRAILHTRLWAAMILCCLSSMPFYAQTDTARVHQALGQARALYNKGSADSAAIYARAAYDLSVRGAYQKGKARSLLLMGACLAGKPQGRDSILRMVAAAMRISSALLDTQLLIQGCRLQGHVYYLTQEWNKSMEHYQKALKLAEASGNKREMASACRQIGVAFVSSGLEGNAMGLKYYERAFELYNQLGDTASVAGMYFVMGIAYNNLGDEEKGKLCQEQLIRYCKALGDEACVVRSQNELAGYYFKKNGLAQAVVLLKDSYLRLKKLKGYQEEIANTCEKLAGALDHLGRTGEALPYREEQLALALEIKNIGQEREAYKGLARYYEFKKNYEKAFLYERKYIEAYIASHEGDFTRQMAEMQARYEADKKQGQIESLEKEKAQQARVADAEKKKQQIIILSISIGLTLVAIFSVFLFNRFRVTQRQKNIIERQKQLVEEKQKDILDSIHYAKRIQRTLLPTEKSIARKLVELRGPGSGRGKAS